MSATDKPATPSTGVAAEKAEAPAAVPGAGVGSPAPAGIPQHIGTNKAGMWAVGTIVTSPNPSASLNAARVFANVADFTINPKFYVLCFHKDSEAFRVKPQILFCDALLKTAVVPQKRLTWEGQPHISSITMVRTIKLFSEIALEFRDSQFNAVSAIEITIAPAMGEDHRKFARLFNHSLLIEDLIKTFNDDPRFRGSNPIYLNDTTPPFLCSVATACHAPDGSRLGADSDAWQWLWTPEFIRAQRELVGKWSDFYVGGFPNYSTELWDSRIQRNLTNRLSELQFIRVNSALIYMTAEEWAKHSPYMNEFFIAKILWIRGLHLLFFVLNKELDQIHLKLMTLDPGDITSCKREIERVRMFEDVCEMLTAHLYEEKLMNRRPHAKKVIMEMFQLMELEELHKFTDVQTSRVKVRVKEANDIALQVQSEKNEASLQLVNGILGSQVVLSVVGTIVEVVGGPPVVFGAINDLTSGSWALTFLLIFLIIGSISLCVRLYHKYQEYQFRKRVHEKKMRVLHKLKHVVAWRAFSRNLHGSKDVVLEHGKLPAAKKSDSGAGVAAAASGGAAAAPATATAAPAASGSTPSKPADAPKS